MPLKDKIMSTVTGDAYDKPAKTKDGAMTTSDSADAHTVKGTTADPDPEPYQPSALENKLEDAKNRPFEKKEEMQNKAENKADSAQNDSTAQKAMDTAKNHPKGQEAMKKADQATN